MDFLPEFEALIKRLIERDIEVVGHHLGDAVGFGIGNIEHPGDIADYHFRPKFSKRDDIGDAFLAVFFPHIIDHFIPPAHAEIDIEIGR